MALDDVESERSDMRVLLIVGPDDQSAQLSCSEKMAECWISFKEKLGFR